MESELKIIFPNEKELYDIQSSTWFSNAIFTQDEKVEQYENRYLDTEDQVLLKTKTSVRVRHIVGKNYVHTVKIGGKSINGFSQRYEWNQETKQREFDVENFLKNAETSDDPLEILKESLAPIKGKTLIDICMTKFKRKTLTAGFGDSIFEICFDVGACIAGEKSEPICELEIELIEGNAEDVKEFGTFVMEHSNGEFSNSSKYGRCLNLLRQGKEE